METFSQSASRKRRQRTRTRADGSDSDSDVVCTGEVDTGVYLYTPAKQAANDRRNRYRSAGSARLGNALPAKCASVATSHAMSSLAKASFGLFLGALPQTSSSQGCFLSPLSIVYALSLAVNGAGPDSPTHAELLRVIAGPDGQGLSEADLNSELGRATTLLNGQCGAGREEPSSEMVLANSMWTRRGTKLKQAYVESMQSLFQATAAEAPNGAQDINSWVDNVTRGMITDLIQTDNFDAVLANAIYFKGLWSHAFKPELTSPGGFTTSTGDSKQVSMMQQLFEGRDKALTGVRKEDLYDAVSLPYKGGTFAAVALLPAQGVDMGEALADWSATGPQEFQPMGCVSVIMPKFKVTSRMTLKSLLQGLGVTAAFSPGSADFSRMAGGGMYIRDVVHKAVVEVDEEGTVAAAATAVACAGCGSPMPPQELVFNRPFAFIIYHNPTGLPAFVGVVNDPSVT